MIRTGKQTIWINTRFLQLEPSPSFY